MPLESQDIFSLDYESLARPIVAVDMTGISGTLDSDHLASPFWALSNAGDSDPSVLVGSFTGAFEVTGSLTVNRVYTASFEGAFDMPAILNLGSSAKMEIVF